MKKTLTTLIVALAFASTQAQFISYEGFATPPYQVGSSVNTFSNSTANGSAWNGSWYDSFGGNANNVISNGSLSYSGLPTTGGHMNISGHDRDARKLPISLMPSNLISGGKVGGPTANGTLYLSFLMTVPTFPGFAALELHDGFSWDPNRRFDVRYTGSEFQANVDLDGNGTNSSSADAQVNLGVAPGANFFVIKFEFYTGVNNDVITVWRNPTLGHIEDGGGLVLTSSYDAQITELSVANFSGGNVQFDEIRLGTTWAAVAIPEPSTYALIIGGALVLGIIVRRRKATV